MLAYWKYMTWMNIYICTYILHTNCIEEPKSEVEMLTLISVLHNTAMAFILKNKGGTGSIIAELCGFMVNETGMTGKTTTGNQTSVANLAYLSLNLPAFQIPLGNLNLNWPVTKLDFFCPEPSPVSKHSASQSHCAAASLQGCEWFVSAQGSSPQSLD